jgi:periplasmic divalent cation tolerance protein
MRSGSQMLSTGRLPDTIHRMSLVHDTVTEYVQVSTATESREAALTLARSVITARLAAGAQVVGPVSSVAWHLGQLVEGEEWQLVLKTRRDSLDELEVFLTEHHPWDNPEISALPIVAASRRYLDWIDRTTGMDVAG